MCPVPGDRIQFAEFAVEANEFGQTALFMEFEARGIQQVRVGCIQTVGYGHAADGLSAPINIQRDFWCYKGHCIMVYYGCSQLVDTKAIHDWLAGEGFTPRYRGSYRQGLLEALQLIDHLVKEPDSPFRRQAPSRS